MVSRKISEKIFLEDVTHLKLLEFIHKKIHKISCQKKDELELKQTILSHGPQLKIVCLSSSSNFFWPSAFRLELG